MLMQPLTTSSPLRVEVPSMTTPSIGTFSPGWTTMTLPGSTSSGSTFWSFPSASMLA